MTKPIRLLFLEDNPRDVDLVRETLQSEGLECKIATVDSRKGFFDALDQRDFDLILADYSLPAFDGLFALDIALLKCPDIPFIFVSGVMGEELAIETLKSGATDYVLKQRLNRLSYSIRRALEEVEQREELQRAREAHHISEARVQMLVEQLPCLLWSIDKGMGLTFCSGQLLNTWQMQPGSILGEHLSELQKARMPNFFQVSAHERALQGGSARFEAEWNHRTYNCHIEALRDADGEVTGAIGLALDISEQKQLSEQLRQSQKMEAVGQLAGGVAHEFNNMLAAVMGYCELILNKEMEPSIRSKVQAIYQVSEKAVLITRQLLTFSRKEPTIVQVLDLNQQLGSISEMIRQLLGVKIELEVKPSHGDVFVKMDPGHFCQIILNLAVNARDAMPHGGKVVLELSRHPVKEKEGGRLPHLKLGEYVLLTVTDNGSGMSREIQQRVFEPFFTTKGPDRGTGLGLSTVYGIMQGLHGSIEVVSEVGEGTAFRLFFPATEERPKKVARNEIPARKVQGHERILLVEDEEYLLRLMQAFLVGLGYKVVEAPNGSEALKKIENSEEPFDLLFTDLVMPGMSGADLAEHVRAIKPEIKILFTSGYNEELGKKSSLVNSQNLVNKPYNLSVLAKKLREVLEEPASKEIQKVASAV
jgi:two-component system, cell cycle sensor histidine kinase and response regulator CckA